MNHLNKIFLIGNGFDLGHELKTSYSHFIEWYVRKNLNEALTKGTCKFEDDCMSISISQIHSNPTFKGRLEALLDELFKSNKLKEYVGDSLPDIGFSNFDFAIKPKNKFIQRILKDCLNQEWSGIEFEIYSFIKQAHTIVNSNFNGGDYRSHTPYATESGNINSLNKSVECLKNNLARYLQTQNEPSKDISSWFDAGLNIGSTVPRDELKKEILFLNFNYTTHYFDLIEILKSRYGKFYHRFNTINIHGVIDDPEQMVFGIGDEENDFYSVIESQYSDEWLKCMKSFHYFKNEHYQNLLGFTNKGNYEVYVMGHSCSITDRTLLNMLFENEYCKAITVYHYKGLNSFIKTTYNIARNFKNKVLLRKLLKPYSDNYKM